MKYKLDQIVKLSSAYSSLKERTVNLTGEVLKGVVIPAKKSKAGYWIGRLESVVMPLNESVLERRRALFKEMGTEIMDKEGKGTGTFDIVAEQKENFNKAIKDLLNEEEEINFCPLKYEHLDDLALPEEFWGAIVPFLSEPVEEEKKK